MQDFCHGMTQLLQGAVDVQAALRCGTSAEFREDAAAVLPDPAGASGDVNRARFLVQLLVRLSVVQVRPARCCFCHATADGVASTHARMLAELHL